MTRVLIAGPAGLAASLATMLRRQGLDVANCVAAGPHLAADVAQTRPRVVVLLKGRSAEAVRDATQAIMTTCPTPVVIAVNPDELKAAGPALRAGALAALAVPPASGPDAEAAQHGFAATVRAMSEVRVVRSWPERQPAAEPPRRPRAARCAVAIGTSTGGPSTLQEILQRLPERLAAPILIVQHMAPGFVASYAQWLESSCGLRVRVAEDREKLVAGDVYVAPDDRHLGVEGDCVALSAEPPVGGFRPAATYLFRSVAASYGADAIGVVLTGMGSDGVEGLRAIRRGGGRVLVQNEESSIVFGMPGAALAAGLAHEILPPDIIAQRLLQLAGTARTQARPETPP